MNLTDENTIREYKQMRQKYLEQRQKEFREFSHKIVTEAMKTRERILELIEQDEEEKQTEQQIEYKTKQTGLTKQEIERIEEEAQDTVEYEWNPKERKFIRQYIIIRNATNKGNKQLENELEYNELSIEEEEQQLKDYHEQNEQQKPLYTEQEEINEQISNEITEQEKENQDLKAIKQEYITPRVPNPIMKAYHEQENQKVVSPPELTSGGPPQTQEFLNKEGENKR